MKVFAHALWLGSALLTATPGVAQTTPATTPATTTTPGAQPRPGARPPLAPRRVVAPRRTGTAQPVRAKTSGVMAKDGVMLTNGRVMYTELGMTAPLTADKKFINGTTVSPTGLITNANGTSAQLAEGDYASLSGRITTKREMVEADSVRKLEDYERKHPGKRKELEQEREKAEKAKEKADKARAKEEAKAKKK